MTHNLRIDTTGPEGQLLLELFRRIKHDERDGWNGGNVVDAVTDVLTGAGFDTAAPWGPLSNLLGADDEYAERAIPCHNCPQDVWETAAGVLQDTHGGVHCDRHAGRRCHGMDCGEGGREHTAIRAADPHGRPGTVVHIQEQHSGDQWQIRYDTPLDQPAGDPWIFTDGTHGVFLASHCTLLNPED